MLVILVLAALGWGGQSDVVGSPHLGPHLGPPLMGPPPYGILRYPAGPSGPPHPELSPDLAPPPPDLPAEPRPPEPPPRHNQHPMPPRGPPGPPGLVMPNLRPMQWSSLLGHHRPMDAMVDVTNELGVSVLQDYSYSRGNFAFSPYGVASVLVVLYEGARGETARQVHNTLKLPWERDVTRVGFRDIHRNLRRYFSHEGYLSGVTLSQSRTALIPEFRRVLRFYGYDVDLPPEGFNYTEAGAGPDRPAVIVTSHQDSNRVNGTTTPANSSKDTSSTTSTETSSISSTSEPSLNTTSEGSSTTPAAISVPVTTATTASATTVAVEANPTSTSPPSSSGMPLDEEASPTTTTSTSAPPSSSSTIATSSSSTTTPPPTSTSEDAVPDLEPGSEVESIPEAASSSQTPGNPPEDAPPAPLTESTTYSPISNSEENEVAGDAPFSEDQIESRIGEDPEPEPELLSTTAETETTPLSTIAFTLPSDETATESTTPGEALEVDPEPEPLSTEVPESTTETTTPPITTPSPSAPAPPPPSQRRARVPGPALSFWTGLEAALARNSTRSRRDVNDLSLQLQNGMFDSHVAVGDELFKQLARRPFLVDGAFEEPVPVMEYTATFPFAYLPRLHALAMEFPLDDERYHLLLLLPVERERHALHHLLHGLSHVTLREVQRALRPRRLHAVVPAFMVEGFVILTPTLQQLGIWDMFDPRRADLSGMTEDPDLYVRNIEQAVTVVIKNYVEILDIQTRTTAARSHLDQFIATHPFLYFVMDSETQVALMAGKVVDPLNSRIY